MNRYVLRQFYPRRLKNSFLVPDWLKGLYTNHNLGVMVSVAIIYPDLVLEDELFKPPTAIGERWALGHRALSRLCSPQEPCAQPSRPSRSCFSYIGRSEGLVNQVQLIDCKAHASCKWKLYEMSGHSAKIDFSFFGKRIKTVGLDQTFAFKNTLLF